MSKSTTTKPGSIARGLAHLIVGRTFDLKAAEEVSGACAEIVSLVARVQDLEQRLMKLEGDVKAKKALRLAG